jgi:hypothetical protein
MERIVVGDVRFVTDDPEMLAHGLEMVMGCGEKMVVEKYRIHEFNEGDDIGLCEDRFVYVVRFASK